MLLSPWPYIAACVRTGCLCCPCPHAAPARVGICGQHGWGLCNQGSYPEAPYHLKREQRWTGREVQTREHRLTPHCPPFLLPLLSPPFFSLPLPPSLSLLSPSSSFLLPPPLGMHGVLITYRIPLCPSRLNLMPTTLDALVEERGAGCSAPRIN